MTSDDQTTNALGAEPQIASPVRTPWRRTCARALAVILTLTVTGGMVSYSAMITFGSPKFLARRSAIRNGDNVVVLTGRVWMKHYDIQVPHDDAIAILWPANEPLVSLPQANLRALPDTPLPESFYCTRVAVDGVFLISDRTFHDFKPGEYDVLVISLAHQRNHDIDRDDLQSLQAHIANAAELLGTQQYHLAKITLDLDEMAESDFVFSNAGAE